MSDFCVIERRRQGKDAVGGGGERGLVLKHEEAFYCFHSRTTRDDHWVSPSLRQPCYDIISCGRYLDGGGLLCSAHAKGRDEPYVAACTKRPSYGVVGAKAAEFNVQRKSCVGVE